MAVQRYSICQDHLKRVLGEESVAKMTFFQAMSAAIRNHRQLVAKEMVFPIQFCLQSSTVITISDVRYSNDGDSDYVEVRLDGERLGTFESHSKTSSGDNWNQFEHTGVIGQPVSVHAGKHVLELVFVSTDRHGIEIDFVGLDVEDEGQDERLLQCAAYCDSAINYSPTLVSDSLPSGWIQQQSHRTSCAEELNVRVALYHPGLASYRLTAHSPRYQTLLNDYHRDFHGCVGTETGHAVWFFTNFDVLPSSDQIQYENSATLSFSGDNSAKNTKLRVVFSPPDLSAIGDGAVLRLKFRRPSSGSGLTIVLLDMTVQGALLTEERSVDVSKNDNEISFEIEADALQGQGQGQGQVELTLTVIHRGEFTLHADYLRLAVRPQAEQTHNVYSDTMTMVEALDVPGGAGGGMLVYRPDNTATWYEVDAVRVMKKVSWSEEFEEIFRLERNGEVHLKPRSAYGSQAPPYGTSVVVGPSDPSASPPVAPIKRIDIDPWALKFTLTYLDSSVSELLVRSGTFGVRVIVNHVRIDPASRAWPVAVVTSMWVADGKADVDHVSANGATPREVLSGWDRLYGTMFAFFRQCVSRHKTQAPDILVELLEADPTISVRLDSLTRSGAGADNMV
nr:hypothetical protein BaRGS_000167 [Batillaria attramentaria]